MSEDGGALLMVMVGAMAVRLVVTGAHRQYVKAAMGPALLVAGTLLVLAGLALLVRRRRTGHVAAGADDAHDHDDHGHGGHGAGGDHHTISRVGWLLLLPLVVLVLVRPAPLGSFALRNRTADTAGAASTTFDALPVGTTVAMSIREYTERAADRDGASLRDVTILLVGFAAPSERGPLALARYQIACCAGDAVASVADLASWDGRVPAGDAWLMIEGRHEPGTGRAWLRPTTVTVIDPPDDPYEE